VWTVNGKQGNVNLTWADLIGMGGAPIMSPAFQGVPTVPSITDDNQHDWQIANTAFVQDVVNCRINGLLHAHPFVWSFNGRIGNVCLTIDDVNAALTSPGAIPITTNPPLGDASTRIATTLFVDGSIEDLRSWVEQQNFAFDQQLTAYAPLASPQFSGIPTAPTAPPATSTGQLATTAYVMAAVQASTSGVVSFNGRTGIVDLLDTDLTNAGGALLVSPVFTGTPQAPTATLGTDTAQLATCAFVLNELGGASIGVMTFNTRAGAVVLTGADITGAGGALLAGPAFSGVPTAPTAATGVATQQLATTAFVAAAIAALSIGVSSFNSRTGAVTLTTNDISAAGGAVLASPIFSGQPTAPTAPPSTSTTQLATTAFVMAAISAANVVSSFNGRAGAVTLTTADVSAAGGPYLPLTGGTLTGNLNISAGLLVEIGSWQLYDRTSTNERINNLGPSYYDSFNTSTGVRSWWSPGLAGAPIMSMNSTGAMTVNGTISPRLDNYVWCGLPGNAWYSVASYAFATQSDPSLKKDMALAPAGALNKVLAVPVKLFRWLNEDSSAALHIGWSATDVSGQMPGSVIGEPGKLALNLAEMNAWLWQAVQELTARVMALENIRRPT
jgi:hypothetical protein